MPEFPTIVYKVPGPHRAPKGKTYAYLGVDDEAAFDAAIDGGWSETLAEALSDKPLVEALGDKPPAIDREEMEDKAKELGVKFNARTKDETLAERILEAMGE